MILYIIDARTRQADQDYVTDIYTLLWVTGVIILAIASEYRNSTQGPIVFDSLLFVKSQFSFSYKHLFMQARVEKRWRDRFLGNGQMDMFCKFDASYN